MNRKQQESTNNPYYYAIRLIIGRLLWDVKAESWRSRKKLKTLKNAYRGQKAAILCNGPSLLKSDLSLLDGIYTFGLNKINLLFEKSDFRPSCIVSVNPHVIEQNATFFNGTSLPLFLHHKATKKIDSRENVHFLHSNDMIKKFAQDCSISIYSGVTVTFVAMQLAYHMGFSQVALIGCDHSFTAKGQPNQTVLAGHRDDDHFAPNYFAGGVKWQLPDLLQSEVNYRMAKEIFEDNRMQIVNATNGGNLEIFQRMDLRTFVNSDC